MSGFVSALGIGQIGGQIATATQAAAEQQQPRILRDLDRLRSLIDGAHQAIEALEQKLGPVLRPTFPTPPSPVNAVRKDANEPRSPVIDMIEAQCRKIEDVSVRIGALIERLDT